MADNWGPWIEWRGGNCPVGLGSIIEIDTVYSDGRKKRGVIKVNLEVLEGEQWQMSDRYGPHAQITRYRIRKSRGMAILESILADPLQNPAQEKAET